MRVCAFILAALLALSSGGLGQQPASVLQGAFTAWAGPGVFRGKWSAQIAERTPNAASGSWILLNERNDVVLQGTWSARKSAAGWEGTWHARVRRGRAYSGTWAASEPGPGKTFAEMLQSATRGSATGTWRSQGYGGNWRLGPTP